MVTKRTPETRKGIGIFVEDAETGIVSDLGFKPINGTQAKSPDPNPEDLAALKERREKINEVLLTLSPREEKVIRSCFLDGLTIQKTAEKLGLEPKEVKRIRKSAIAKLRKAGRSSRLTGCL